MHRRCKTARKVTEVGVATVVVEEGAVEAAGSWKTMHTVEFSGEYYGHEEHLGAA